MPRTDRTTCVGCDKRIDGGSLYGFSNNMFRLFISARALKKVTISDAACRKCRWKFGNWMKKTKGDFNDFMETEYVEKVMVNLI